MRIHVTGNAGSGKTTLTKHLSSNLRLPAYHLDSIVWRPGWQKTDSKTRSTLEEELANKPSWVIDGASDLIRSKADLTLFLDVPRRICAWRCLSRSARHLFVPRPELPPGCPEWKIIPRLIKIIWMFPSNYGDRIMKESATNPRIVRVADLQEATRYVMRLGCSAMPATSLQRTH